MPFSERIAGLKPDRDRRLRAPRRARPERRTVAVVVLRGRAARLVLRPSLPPCMLSTTRMLARKRRHRRPERLLRERAGEQRVGVGRDREARDGAEQESGPASSCHRAGSSLCTLSSVGRRASPSPGRRRRGSAPGSSRRRTSPGRGPFAVEVRDQPSRLAGDRSSCKIVRRAALRRVAGVLRQLVEPRTGCPWRSISEAQKVLARDQGLAVDPRTSRRPSP